MTMPGGPGGNNENKPAFAKIAVYADTGETVVTNFVQEDELMFDDLPAKFNELDMPLFVNSVFAHAGKNFNGDENWNSSAPVILKNVDTGKDVFDYSIVRQDEDASAFRPCRKFKIVEKGDRGTTSYAACASRDIGTSRLPFTVYFNFIGTGSAPSWKLKSVLNEKPTVAWTPQCLEAVRCKAVKWPSDAQRRVCEGKGGSIEPDNNDAGCTTAYKCRTEEDMVKQSISNTQRPGCDVNSAVMAKLLSCRKQNKPNFDPKGYDNAGCLTDVACRS